MPIERFSFIVLEKQLEEIEFDIDKIEFISKEIVRCRNAIQDVKCEAKNIEPAEIKLSAKTVNQETSLVELVNSNKKIKRTITKKIVKICAKNLCKEYCDYLKRSENHLAFYKTKLEARATWNECSKNGNNSANDDNPVERIIWLLGKEKLLRLFVRLFRDEYITEYSKEEILVHFVDEKQIPFYQVKNHSMKIRWRKSDESFSVFTGELSKRHMIDNKNIDRIFEKHFVNRDGNSFKDLAQKRYNTKNFTKTENIICKLLDSISISMILAVNTYSMFNDLVFEGVLNHLSTFIVI
jgi:hypothetical protein